MRRLNPREKKLVAVGILIILVALAFALIVRPIVGGFNARAEERQRLLGTYQRDSRALGSLHVVGADLRVQRTTDGRYAVSAPSPAVASAFLRERVGRIVTQSGGTLKTTEDLQADARPGELRVRADAALTTAQLVQVVRRLETEEPYAVIDNLASAVGNDASSGREDPMAVRLEVSTRFRPAAPGRG